MKYVTDIYDNTTKKWCPRHEHFYTEYPALSRLDNKTYVCTQAGQEEALDNFIDKESKEEN